jgi:hypothetical protein
MLMLPRTNFLFLPAKIGEKTRRWRKPDSGRARDRNPARRKYLIIAPALRVAEARSRAEAALASYATDWRDMPRRWEWRL